MPKRLGPVAAIAAAVWLFDDLTRVWAPSLITIFGQAAATPAELMGLFALGCLLLPLVLLLPRHGRSAWLLLAIALGCRIAVQPAPGGDQQLWTASIGVAAAVAWLSLLVARHRTAVAPGLALGWLVAMSLHAALGTWGTVWRAESWAWIPLAALLLLALLSARAAIEPTEPASRRRMVAFWPLLLIAGVALVNAGRASTIDPLAGPAFLVAGCVVAATLAGRPIGRGGRIAAALVLVVAVTASLLVTQEVDGVGGALSRCALLSHLLGPAAVVVLIDEPPSRTTATPPRGLLVAAGGVLWVVLFFAYYAGYDLGYRADVLLVAVAALLGGLLAAGGERETAERRGVLGVVPLLLAPVLLAAATLGPSWTVSTSARMPASEHQLTVVAYNLRMGYGMDGRFDPLAVAELLDDADIALLSEIDRGWLLNGGQDQLAILARLLDTELYFSPAADPVWGDAVLTRRPVHEVRGTQLASYGAVTGAGILAVRTELADAPLWVVSTHVQPTATGPDGTIDQAREIADFIRELSAGGDEVIVGGDFNLEPGTPSWRALLDAGLVDGLADARPLPTSDSVTPRRQIDHVLLSPGLSAAAARAPRTQASDHLPVMVAVSRSER